MKRSLLVVLALLAIGIPVWADGTGPVVVVTLSPASQTLPVSTSATLTLGWELTQNPAAGAYTGTDSLEYQVLSGPDAGSVVTLFSYTFTAFDLDMPHSTTFSFTNDGTAGTDVVEAFLVDAADSFTFTSNTADVNWSTPEPPSGLLLAMAVPILLLLTRRREFFPS
jgi:hypothetical protein